MLLFIGLKLPHTAMLFSSQGLVIPYDFTMAWGHIPGIPFFQNILTPPSPAIAFAIVSLHVACLAAFTAGLRTRLCAFIIFVLFLYEYNLSYHHMGTSYNRLFLFFSFLFIFAESGKTFSADMFLRHGSVFAWEPISIFFQRTIAIQITATYLGVGLQKLWLPDWETGSMLYLSFQSMWATPIAFWVLSLSPPMWIFDLLVWIVKAFEISLPFGLWHTKSRWWWIAGGVVFHVGTSIFLAAIWWFYAMIACYITFFKPEDVLQTLRRKLPKIPALPAPVLQRA